MGVENYRGVNDCDKHNWKKRENKEARGRERIAKIRETRERRLLMLGKIRKRIRTKKVQKSL